jgi:hypothetical protein
MSLGIATILTRVADHGRAAGTFERVLIGEPKSPPGQGRTMAVWAGPVGPASSGLSSTSLVMRFAVRVYVPMLKQPQEDIELSAVAAADVLMAAYNGDFSLGGAVRNVDIFGEYGTALTVDPGYVTLDSTMFRVMDINLPLVINDVYEQVA